MKNFPLKIFHTLLSASLLLSYLPYLVSFYYLPTKVRKGVNYAIVSVEYVFPCYTCDACCVEDDLARSLLAMHGFYLNAPTQRSRQIFGRLPALECN